MKKWLAIITLMLTLLLVCLSLGSCNEKNTPDDTSEDTPNDGLEFTLHELDGVKFYKVTGIGDCKDADIVIPERHQDIIVKYIADGAFENCQSIKSITLSDNIWSIGKNAFRNCTNLEKVDIGNGVTTIYSNAFFGCTGLKELRIGKALRDLAIDFSLDGEERDVVFGKCATSLETIYVSPENSVFTAKDNCLINVEESIMILGCKNSIIPNDGSVFSFESGAFEGCQGLKSITIPSSISLIGEYMFAGCASLESVTLEASNVSVWAHAFENCTSLKEVSASKIAYVDVAAFKGCTALNSITLARKLSSIGPHAFASNTEIIFDGAPIEWERIYKEENWHEASSPKITFTKDNSEALTEEEMYSERYVNESGTVELILGFSRYKITVSTDGTVEEGEYFTMSNSIFFEPDEGNSYNVLIEYTRDGMLIDGEKFVLMP